MSEAPQTSKQEFVDREHLKLLAIFQYVVGGLVIAFSSIFLIHVGFGIALAINPELLRGLDGKAPPFPPFLGLFFAIFAGFFVLAGWTLGGFIIYSGRCIQKRRKRLLSLIAAGIACAWFPFGTALGVFTIIVLSQESVKRLYGE